MSTPVVSRVHPQLSSMLTFFWKWFGRTDHSIKSVFNVFPVCVHTSADKVKHYPTAIPTQEMHFNASSKGAQSGPYPRGLELFLLVNLNELDLGFPEKIQHSFICTSQAASL